MPRAGRFFFPSGTQLVALLMLRGELRSGYRTRIAYNYWRGDGCTYPQNSKWLVRALPPDVRKRLCPSGKVFSKRFGAEPPGAQPQFQRPVTAGQSHRLTSDGVAAAIDLLKPISCNKRLIRAYMQLLNCPGQPRLNRGKENDLPRQNADHSVLPPRFLPRGHRTRPGRENKETESRSSHRSAPHDGGLAGYNSCR